MTIEAIERLVRRLEQSDITEFELSDEGSSLKLRLRPRSALQEPGMARPAAPAASPSLAPEGPVVRAGAIGLLRLRHPDAAPDADSPFPRSVAAGEIVAFLEAGPCLRPVVTERAGTLGPPLLADGSLVGFGTPLFPLS